MGCTGCDDCNELGQGEQGYAGWSPMFQTVQDNVNLDGNGDYRIVLQLTGWTGGEGPTPTAFINQYLSSSGFTTTLASATNFRGSKGAPGTPGEDGTDATVTVNSVLGLDISGTILKQCLDFEGNTFGDYITALIANACSSSGGGSVTYTNQESYYAQFDGTNFTAYTLTKANAISQSGSTIASALAALPSPSFTVPAGVTSIQVELFAGGGTDNASDNKGNAVVVKTTSPFTKLYAVQGDCTSTTSTSGGISNCIFNLNGENGHPPSQPSPASVGGFVDGSSNSQTFFQKGFGGVGGKGGKGATNGYGDGSSGLNGDDGANDSDSLANFGAADAAADGQWGAGGGSYGKQVLSVTAGDVYRIYTFFHAGGKHNNNSKVIISYNA